MRHLLSLFDLSPAEILRIFAIAEDLKSKHAEGIREPLMPGRVLALLFEKPSLRTRVSFEAAMAHLGGTTLFLGEDVGWGKRESPKDFTQVLGQFVDVIACRAKSHAKVVELAQYSPVPVINALTDQFHPCQALADLLTLREAVGTFDKTRLAYVGDANNVACSLALACKMLGVEFSIAAPEKYSFAPEFVRRLDARAGEGSLTLTTDPVEAVTGAAAVYTDVWASMGQEAEKEQRQRDFADYQVNGKLMSAAPADAIFLHCLPARRGLEVTDEVMDGPKSAVVPQAANRMHAQKAVLAWLLGTKDI